MSVKVNIHLVLCGYTNRQDVIEVNGSTVGGCLEQAVAQLPELNEELFDKSGKLLDCIDISVNGEDAYPEELAKSVNDGDELYIAMNMGCQTCS